jgi:DNA-binding HxlR family transcriptional regulator
VTGYLEVTDLETAMAEWNVFDERCPTRLVLSRIADKWTVLICMRLAQGTMRFGELRRQVSGISQKVLTHSLRALERDGLVARKVYAQVPARVEYSLTPLGRTLVRLMADIKDWAEANIEVVLAAQQAYDRAQQQAPDQKGPVRLVRLATRAA